jgi:hypothetical protein
VEYVIQVLIVFILTGSLLKLSFWKFWQVCLFGFVCAAFVAGTCGWAIEQSKTQLADFLGHAKIMQDAAVLVTVESALCFTFCFAELRAMFGSGNKKWWRPVLGWYPGLLIFPVLFYLQTQLVFALPGVGFTTISHLMAAGVMILIPSLAVLIRRLYPERGLRLEVLFLASLFVCVVGLIATVNGNVTYAAVEEAVNLKAIALAAGTFLVLFGTGLMWNRLKWKIKKNDHHGNHL